MQYCPKCGARNPDENTQCAGCGASFSQVSAGPQGPQGPQVPQQPQGPQYTPPPPPPQTPGYRPPAPPKPNNYLVWSILVTLCCCLPGGIASIVFASKVDSQYNGGDYAGAQESSDKARMWIIISAIVGFIVNIIYGFIQLAAMSKGGRFQGM